MIPPKRIVAQLRKIASDLEASSNPSRELVAKDIKRVVSSLTKTAGSLVVSIADWGYDIEDGIPIIGYDYVITDSGEVIVEGAVTGEGAGNEYGEVDSIGISIENALGSKVSTDMISDKLFPWKKLYAAFNEIGIHDENSPEHEQFVQNGEELHTKAWKDFVVQNEESVIKSITTGNY